MEKKQVLLILFIIFVAGVVRFNYPNTHLTDREVQEITNVYGHTYLYQFDSYAFIDSAWNYDKHIDLWGWQVYFLPEDKIESVKFLSFFWLAMVLIVFYFTIITIVSNQTIAGFGTLLLAINTTFLRNSYWGYADRNIFNHFLIISLVLIALLIFKYKKPFRYYLIIAFCVVSFIFAKTWKGWFPIIIILSISFITRRIFNEFDTTSLYLITGTFLGSLILTYLNSSFIVTYLRFGGQFSDKYAIISEILPRTITFFDCLIYVGLLLGILIIIVKNKKFFGNYLVFYWILFFGFAASRANRHIFYFIMPAIIGMCIIINQVRFIIGNRQTLKYVIIPLIVIITIYSGLFVLKSSFVPNMDNSIYHTMTHAKYYTSEKIILSWWDYGIMYKAYSGKDVPFRSVAPDNSLIISALFETNETIAKQKLYNLSKGIDYLVVVNSGDIDKIPMMERYSGIEFTTESIMYRMLSEEDFEHFKIESCKTGEFRKVCLYSVI